MEGTRAEMHVPARAPCTGAAWLSSARVVRCWVKSRNERNPRSQLPARYGGGTGGTAGAKTAEGGGGGKSSWSLRLGLHTCYNGRYSGSHPRKSEPIPIKPASVRIGGCNSPP